MKNKIKLLLTGITLFSAPSSASSILQFLPAASNLPTMISAESPGTYAGFANANSYCLGLNTANAGAGTACALNNVNVACGATQYNNGWRVPSVEEMALFAGFSGSTANYLITRSASNVLGSSIVDSVVYQLSTGLLSTVNSYPTFYVRCVR